MSTLGQEHLIPKRSPGAGSDFFSSVRPDHSATALEDHISYALDLGDLAIQLVDGKPINHYVPSKWLETAIPLIIPTLLGSPTLDIIPGISVNIDPASLPTITIDSQTPALAGAVGKGGIEKAARGVAAQSLDFLNKRLNMPEFKRDIKNQTATTTHPQLKVRGITINIDRTAFPRDKMNNPLLILLDSLYPPVNRIVIDEIALENTLDSKGETTDEVVLASAPQLRVFTPTGEAVNYASLFSGVLNLASPQENLKRAAQAATNKAAGMLTKPTRKITHAGIKITGDPQNRAELSGLRFAIY